MLKRRRNLSGSKRALGVAGGVHALQDGYTDLVYVMLPIWQAEFALTYGAVGMLRGLFVGAMAGFQIPATMLAKKVNACIGRARRRRGADGLRAISSPGFSGGFTVIAHHRAGARRTWRSDATSARHLALVAGAFPGKAALKALGTYNFAGDIGKMTLPAPRLR